MPAAVELAIGTMEKLSRLPVPWHHVWRAAEALGAKPKHPVIFECVGVPGIIDGIIASAPLFSRVVVVGVCMGADRIRPAMAINKEIDLRFVVGYTPLEFRDTLHMLAEGKVNRRPVVTGVVGLARRRRRLRRARRPRGARKDPHRPARHQRGQRGRYRVRGGVRPIAWGGGALGAGRGPSRRDRPQPQPLWPILWDFPDRATSDMDGAAPARVVDRVSAARAAAQRGMRITPSEPERSTAPARAVARVKPAVMSAPDCPTTPSG